MNDVYQRARERVESSGLYSLLTSEGYQVKQNQNFKCILPSHEDSSPSAKIYNNRYQCFSASCGQSLDAIDLFALLRGVSKLESAQFLAGDNPSVKGPQTYRRKRRYKSSIKKPIQPKQVTPTPYPHRLGLSSEALKVLEAFWQLAKPSEIDEAGTKLLISRSINPNQAYLLGVRSVIKDFHSVLLQNHSEASLIEAGFLDDKGAKFLKHSGIIIPIWADADLGFPLAWRLRPLHQSTGPKVYAMPKRGVSPLGLYSLRWGAGSPQLKQGNKRPRALIITEGEPDYLSLVTLGELLSDVAIISITGQRYPKWFPTLICKLAVEFDSCQRIIDLTHMPKNDQPTIAQRLINDLAPLIPSNKRPGFIAMNQPEDYDLNDQLQKGELIKLIDRITPFIMLDNKACYPVGGWTVYEDPSDNLDDLPEFLRNI